MKEWKRPEVWELGVEMTASYLGEAGNDQWLPDRIEIPLENLIGKNIIGERS